MATRPNRHTIGQSKPRGVATRFHRSAYQDDNARVRRLTGSELPRFVELSSPTSALVGATITEIVLAASDRTRRIRAWVRFSAVSGLLGAAVSSGSARWWLVLPWFATVGLTVLHAYRNALARRHREWGSRAPRLAAFVGRHLLTQYSVKPQPNGPGVLDGLGCLWGMVISGQLSSWAGLNLFRLDDLDQAAAAPAGGVLAAVVLLGGAQIVTNSYSWHTLDVEHDRVYRRSWTVLALLATLIVTAALWPGVHPGQAGFETRVVLDMGAATVTVFTCFFGRLSVSRQIRLLDAQLKNLKDTIRRVDAEKVHLAKTRLKASRTWLEAMGNPTAAVQVDKVVSELGVTEDEMRGHTKYSTAAKLQLKSVSALYAQWLAQFIAGNLAPRTWSGVVRDIALDKAAPHDVEFVDLAVRNLLSNAVNQRANDFRVAVYPQIPDHANAYTIVVIEARCVCNARFDGSQLPAGHGLVFLRDTIQKLDGDFVIEETAAVGAGGDHQFRLWWTTYADPLEIEPRPVEDFI